MFALVYVTKRVPGLTRDQFLQHYRDIHYPIACRLPGLVSYRQMPIERGGYLGGAALADYDAVSEYVFVSSSDAEAAFTSPAGIALNDDTSLFIDWASVITLPVVPIDHDSASPVPTAPLVP